MTYRVEMCLMPTNMIPSDPDYGPTWSRSLWLPAMFHPNIRWHYSRAFVPDALARAGMHLDDWQKAFDIANDYWKERYALLCRREAGTGWVICARLALILIGTYVFYAILGRRTWLHECALCILSFAWTRWLLDMTISANSPETALWSMYHDAIDELDNEFTHQVEVLNTKIQKSNGINMFRRTVHGRFESAGLGFCFRVQSANDENVSTWIIANSHKTVDHCDLFFQHSDVSVAEELSSSSSSWSCRR